MEDFLIRLKQEFEKHEKQTRPDSTNKNKMFKALYDIEARVSSGDELSEQLTSILNKLIGEYNIKPDDSLMSEIKEIFKQTIQSRIK